MLKKIHSKSLNITLKHVPVCLRVRYGSEALGTIYPMRLKENNREGERMKKKRVRRENEDKTRAEKKEMREDRNTT
jgi:hypothetical protein